MNTPKHAHFSPHKLSHKREVSRYIILVPHRDSLKPFADYRRRLFAAGFSGAYSFPLAAPLACVSRRFSENELKELSVNIRKLTENSSGKISSGANGIVHCQKSGLSFFGPRFDVFSQEAHDPSLLQSSLSQSGLFQPSENIFPKTAAAKIISAFPSPLLCASLLSDKNADFEQFEQSPPFSFRSGFVANLAVRPLPSGDTHYSFEWLAGKQHWLAKFSRKIVNY